MLNLLGSWFVDLYMVEREKMDRFEKLVTFIKNPVSFSGYDYPEQDGYGGSNDDAGSQEREQAPDTSTRAEDLEFGTVDPMWFAGVLDPPLGDG